MTESTFPLGFPNFPLIPIPSSFKSNILHGMYLKSDKNEPRYNQYSYPDDLKKKQKNNINNNKVKYSKIELELSIGFLFLLSFDI